MNSSFVIGVLLLAMLASLAFMWIGQNAMRGKGVGFAVFTFFVVTVILAPYIATMVYAIKLVSE